MEPADADAYFGRVLRGSPSGTRLARSQALSTYFLFLEPRHKVGRLAAAGIPALRGRTAAMRQLVLQAPPSVVAGMLGYHSVHAEAIAAEAGGTWKHYAPGDHSR
ncbi:hypothetical protein ACIGZJ_31840 [Kitasatospora sp. NPDC052868]|uniref:hypothetical protein n=1 Tax=Kitasatospora sp. NPDC052868 TaxID=3364060 RepID=UPI0037C65F77